MDEMMKEVYRAIIADSTREIELDRQDAERAMREAQMEVWDEQVTAILHGKQIADIRRDLLGSKADELFIRTKAYGDVRTGANRD